ncbi:MAG TPA: MarR family winged helix-turn-helix transcriptional regulator [Acidimicrobiales bacterium]|nr:MarR family winged helix-turn-helix transcriptional regulator [Acidimicrobiales bacterium]
MISYYEMFPSLSDSDYAGLLEFRDALRRFLHWSEQLALASGITPAQHQLLLAIRGHPTGPPTIGEVARHLLLRHHSVVGLVDRAEGVGLVERRADSDDGRVVRLALTPLGVRRLDALAAAHVQEIEGLGSHLRPVWEALSAPRAKLRR